MTRSVAVTPPTLEEAFLEFYEGDLGASVDAAVPA